MFNLFVALIYKQPKAVERGGLALKEIYKGFCPRSEFNHNKHKDCQARVLHFLPNFVSKRCLVICEYVCNIIVDQCIK